MTTVSPAEEARQDTLKVLCIIDTLGMGGGAEQLIASLAEPMRQLAVELVFVDLFGWPDDLGKDLEAQSFTVHRLKMKSQWNFIFGLIALSKIVKIHSVKMVWGNLFFGNLYASMLQAIFPQVKGIITLHSCGAQGKVSSTVKSRMVEHFEKFFTTRAKYKVAVSRSVRSHYLSNRHWKDIIVIPNGVDVNKVTTISQATARQNIRESFSIGKPNYLVTVPARFVKEKGHSILIDAIALMDSEYGMKPIFILVGQHTPLVNAVRDKCSEKGLDDLRVRFSHPIPHKELIALMASSDCVVLSSLQEAFGIAAVEAMACNVPVVLTRIDGLAELDPFSSYVHYVEPGDAKQLAAAIAHCLQNHTYADQMSHGMGTIIAKKFDISKCAEKWSDLMISGRCNE